jgi:hypothetical protein
VSIEKTALYDEAIRADTTGSANRVTQKGSDVGSLLPCCSLPDVSIKKGNASDLDRRFLQHNV